MKEKDLIKLLENRELMTTIISSTIKKDFYVTNKRPVYSLKDCLETIDDGLLDTIYVTYKYVFMPDELKEDVTKEQKIELLHKGIIDVFNSSIKMFGQLEAEAMESFLNQKNRKSSFYIVK